jgi:NAD(P)-dependent dehydrogenase (short-subunit alcohol dehydrogenase family)
VRTPRFSGYIASKAALEAFSDAVQAETLGDGIRFTTISMPLVRTPMLSPTRQYEAIPALTPEEAGRLVAEAVSGRPRRVAPPFAHILSTVDRLSPEAMDAVRNRVYRMFPE